MKSTTYTYGFRERQAAARELYDRRAWERDQVRGAIDALLSYQADLADAAFIAAIDDCVERLTLQLQDGRG